jgi:hypothetical protein
MCNNGRSGAVPVLSRHLRCSQSHCVHSIAGICNYAAGDGRYTAQLQQQGLQLSDRGAQGGAAQGLDCRGMGAHRPPHRWDVVDTDVIKCQINEN